MVAFVTDTFTDTDGNGLNVHTGELGATWTIHAGGVGTNPPIFASNKIKAQTSANNIWYASGTPASADYTASVDITFNGAGSSEIAGPSARLSTSANTGYHFISFTTSGARIYKYVAGSLTGLGSFVTFPPASGVTYRMTIDVSGTTIAARIQRLSDSQWLDSAGSWGASQVNCISLTDSSISASGQPGFWFSSPAIDATRCLLDNYSAAEAGGGGGITGPLMGGHLFNQGPLVGGRLAL